LARRVDALVIGAGPGGYVAALRLGQLGKETLLVERDRLGGECLNYGCIPSKALINTASLINKVRGAEEMGIAAQVKVDMARLQRWKTSVVERLTSGIAQLCKGNGVEVAYGSASFKDPRRVEVRREDGAEEVQVENVIIATGSHPVQLPGLEHDGNLILGSREALELEEVPGRLLVVGGGITGLEIATMYNKLGSEVTVVEMMDRLMPGYPGIDDEMVRVVARSLKRLGVKYHTGSKVKALERRRDGLVVSVNTPDGVVDYPTDKVLVSVGRRPTTEGLDLARAGVALDGKGFIKVDRSMRTNVAGIYAIGDVAGVPFLAHKASYEGKVAAEAIAGLPAEADYVAIPSAVFTDPEVAYVGLTGEEAKEKGHRTVTGKFPFAALGRALTMDEPDGFVRVVADAESRLILGVQAVGAYASDLISEAALALEMGATVEDLALTIHPHPTLPEAIMEAAEAALGKSVHILRK
jgi:dihydrolipoamide dehydrogenase